ncbi:putative sphingosine-1-phosphate phosphohydrolase [Hibiscus syriacus]|uniref:Sphingosine-1-phosphate phosphohydrolase n=1 Tax=Hibiscus syriacus TaxID=106335 RepID=A0A6A3AEQ9_HIBSY|nr:zinc finger protein 8-like [Hibiscus syriacus]KAE8702528.1 putative sphingosine-1-phosphate phosphohydrolase [Hibiscus syriacus]
MEKNNEKETHDFMNVESFSQIPFIRPSPIKEKGIRLFGKEFGGRDCVDSATVTDSEPDSAHNNKDKTKENENEDNNNSISRRFECHYCCRNFPTSQALGGHQNAHRRERQHAKRYHLTLQRSSSSHDHAHNIYGFFNYKLASAPSPSMAAYPSWNNSINSSVNSSNGRFYENHSSFSQPQLINGTPLGLWRIPASTVQSGACNFNCARSSTHPLPFFAGDELKQPSQVVVNGSSSQSRRYSSSQSRRYVYESKPNVNDHVSLDLHL